MGKSSKSKKKRLKKGLISRFGAILGIASFLVLASIIGIVGTKNSPQPCANSISCIKDLSGAYEPQATGQFMGQAVSVPSEIAQADTSPKVLGESTAAKHIYVDLSKQRLYAYEDNQKVYDFIIASGKWHPTPTGDFKIWIKLRYTRMTGGSGADAYDLPNVPFTMFFYNDQTPKSDGFSIHGAYWHDNFG